MDRGKDLIVEALNTKSSKQNDRRYLKYLTFLVNGHFCAATNDDDIVT